MARYLAGVVAPELGRFERELAARKDPDALTAWECAQRGDWHLYKLTGEGAEKARLWFERSITLDARFGQGHAGLANAYLQLAFLGPASLRESMIDKALKSSAEALRLAPEDAYSHFVRARALTLDGLREEAIAESDAALAANPTFAHAYYAKGCAQATSAEGLGEAIENFDRAIAMCGEDPLLTSMYLMKSLACLALGDLAAAEQAARLSVRRHNATRLAYAVLAAILGAKGDRLAAAAVARSVGERDPAYNCASFADDCFFINDNELKSRLAAGLRAAGFA
jgi:adenylate cyclase